MKKEIVLKLFASLVALILSMVLAPTVVAFQPDPTKPSQLIGDRLRRLDIAEEHVRAEPGIAKKDFVVLPMRLKGIVLSDDDHGTAIIEYNRADIYRVPLQRVDPTEAPRIDCDRRNQLCRCWFFREPCCVAMFSDGSNTAGQLIRYPTSLSLDFSSRLHLLHNSVTCDFCAAMHRTPARPKG